MKYWHLFQTNSNSTTDISNGSNYKTLCKTHVTIGGEKQHHKFFKDPWDIALGLSTDGFTPFKKWKHTCWPLILFNYNLPPEIHFLIQHLICIGIIPGPKKPKDFDSFLWPLIKEFLVLSLGVWAFDVMSETMFTLRAFLILIFGDMPAISMVMCRKGHNGIIPCRMCLIKAIRIPSSKGTTHYVPLDCSWHSDVRRSPTEINKYDLTNLPLSTHTHFMDHAWQAQFADMTAEEECIAKSTGIKGIPVLSYLISLFFPLSFPFYAPYIWELNQEPCASLDGELQRPWWRLWWLCLISMSMGSNWWSHSCFRLNYSISLWSVASKCCPGQVPD